MAQKIKKRKTQDSWKKKKWFTIVAPKSFDEKVIGSTPAEAEKKIRDRVIKVPLSQLTGNISQQFVKIKFRTGEIKGQTVHTELTGFELTTDFIHRNVRRRRSMIRSIQTLNTKDNKKIRITIYAFTRRKVGSQQKKALRTKMTEMITGIIKENSFEDLVKNCVNGTIGKDVYKSMRKMGPVKSVDVSKCRQI